MVSDLPNIDLCTLPAAKPPEGELTNFSDPGTLAPAVIAVCTVMMASSLVTTGGRLFANKSQLAWSDYCCMAGLGFAVVETSLMLFQLHIARHQWNIPVCWLLGDTVKFRFGRSLITIMATSLAKTSIFLLLHQIFTLERGMIIAIRIGLVATCAVLILSFVSQCWNDIPRAGETWDDVALKFDRMVVWSPAASILYLLLDLYIFFLPLPVVARLSWPTRKRLKALAVFSTGFLAVIATAVSLVYRLRLWANSPDKSWKAAIVLLCSVVELHITIIVSSMPGFSKFVRVYLVSKAPECNSSDYSSEGNTPRIKRDREQYLELSDSWLFKSNAIAEGPANTAGATRTLDDGSQSFSEGPLPENVMIVRGISGGDVFREQGVEREYLRKNPSV
ncbi:hypothetical protein B0I37DRAFT_18758 [Chaetomium sp. MPI-CAGE-AT-0009]|nr:hypothetical protein B0I37DRAFT_18758 [Chaetomium sp. MPI-CAGE-AT-0009]